MQDRCRYRPQTPASLTSETCLIPRAANLQADVLGQRLPAFTHLPHPKEHGYNRDNKCLPGRSQDNLEGNKGLCILMVQFEYILISSNWCLGSQLI